MHACLDESPKTSGQLTSHLFNCHSSSVQLLSVICSTVIHHLFNCRSSSVQLQSMAKALTMANQALRGHRHPPHYFIKYAISEYFHVEPMHPTENWSGHDIWPYNMQTYARTIYMQTHGPTAQHRETSPSDLHRHKNNVCRCRSEVDSESEKTDGSVTKAESSWTCSGTRYACVFSCVGERLTRMSNKWF